MSSPLRLVRRSSRARLALWAILPALLALSPSALPQDKAAAPRRSASAAPSELDALLAAYRELLLSPVAPPEPLSAGAAALLADPGRLLALLEQRFQAAPSIESLAWYGSVAEDVAYLGVQRRVDPKTGIAASAPAGAVAWLRPARATWRRMTARLEAGWPAGQPWPRFGRYAFDPVVPVAPGTEPSGWPMEHLLVRWFVPVRASLFRADADLYAIAGEPMAKRQITRKGRDGTAEYVAEISQILAEDPGVFASSRAGDFRVANGLVEFLKGQPEPVPLKFFHVASYGIDGLLGTVGIEVRAPASLEIHALHRQGSVRATSLRLDVRSVPRCGPGQSMHIGMETPLPGAPLAWIATLRPYDDAATKVQALGAIDLRQQAALDISVARRYTGFRVDLDGDGQPDLLVVQGRGAAVAGVSGEYGKDDEGLFSAVWANVGGRWKRVAVASEDGCT